MKSPEEGALSQYPYRLRPRTPQDWRDMAIVVQANLVALRVHQCRRAQVPGSAHEIRTPAPGAVKRFREHLLPREAVASLDDEQLGLRTRQVWGEFSALCWLFHAGDPNIPPAFGGVDLGAARCPAEVAGKVEEVRRTLWRIRFEQHLRFVPGFRLRPDFHELRTAASEIQATIYDRPVHTARPEALVLCAVETAGIMGALRWAMDQRWEWEQEGVSDVGLE